MPFADVAGAIAGFGETLAERWGIRLQFDIVDEDAVSEGVLASHDAGAGGTADGASGNGVIEADAFVRQAIEHGRVDVRVAVVAGRLRTPLVRDDEQNVGLPRAGCSCRRHGQGGGFQEVSSSNAHRLLLTETPGPVARRS